MNSRIWNQIGLELGQINIESSIKAQRGSDGRDDLSNNTIEIRVGGSFNIQIPSADVINGLIVDHESAIRMLQSCMGSQD